MHGTNKGTCVHGTNKGTCVHGTNKGTCVHGTNKGTCVHGTNKGTCVHGTNKGTCVHGLMYSWTLIDRIHTLHSEIIELCGSGFVKFYNFPGVCRVSVDKRVPGGPATLKYASYGCK